MNFSISAFVAAADFYWTSKLLTIGSDFDGFFSDGEHLSGANRISRRAQTFANTTKKVAHKNCEPLMVPGAGVEPARHC